MLKIIVISGNVNNDSNVDINTSCEAKSALPLYF